MRLVLYTGKGGVGKTTTAAATALCAAAKGKRTLLLSTDSSHSLSDVLGQRIGPKRIEVAPNLTAIEVDARAEIARHWGKVSDFLVSLFRHQGIEGVVAEELALLPGAEEIATLLAVDEYAHSGEFEFAVVDCAPTDTTLRLLTLPEVAHSSVRLLLKIQRSMAKVLTPLAKGVVSAPLPRAEVFDEFESFIYAKLRDLRARMINPETSIRLVVTSEKMVIEEARRAFTDLCLFGLRCDAVVINRLLPEAAMREPFFQEWGRVQHDRTVAIAEAFAPLRVLCSALREEEVIGTHALEKHGEEIFGECEPDGILARVSPISFRLQAGAYSISIPLPGASLDALEITKIDGELFVKSAAVSRALKLPRRMAALVVSEAHFRDGVLTVNFRDGAGDADDAQAGVELNSEASEPASSTTPSPTASSGA